MKINMRKGVFETNSSSMHSLCINKEKVNLEFHTPEIMNVELGDYGWGYEILNTPEDKLSYIITSIQYHDNDVIDRESLRNNNYFIWLKEMIFEFTGSIINLVSNTNEDDLGYVDHQSTDILDSIWIDDEKEFKEVMKNIIFNKEATIIISNDN